MDRRQEILAAAAGAFAQYGFPVATTRRIAEAAGVNAVALFRQLRSEECLHREGLQHNGLSVGSTEPPPLPGAPIRVRTACREAFITHLRLRSRIVRRPMSGIDEHRQIASCS